MSNFPIPPGAREIYISDNGNDSNKANSPNFPKLTLAASVAAASALTPTTADPAAIIDIGTSVYTENLVIPDNVFVRMIGALMSAASGIVVTAGANASSEFQTVRTGSTNSEIAFSSGGKSRIGFNTFAVVLNGNSQVGIQINGASDQVFTHVSQIISAVGNIGNICLEYVSSGDPAGHTFDEIRIEGTDGVAVSLNTTSSKALELRGGSIVAPGVNNIGLEAIAGIITAYINSVEAPEAIFVAPGATINIFDANVIGAIVVSAGGTLNCTITSHTGIIVNAGTINGVIGSDTYGDQTILDNLIVKGNMIVEGTTTTIDSENLSIADPYIDLNYGYTAQVQKTGGIVSNCEATGVGDTISGGDFVAGIASTSNPTVETVGSATFSQGMIIQISANESNNGIFEVEDHTGNLLTIRGIGTVATVEDFTVNQFTTETGDGVITQIDVCIIRVNSNNVWEQGTGRVTPISYEVIANIDFVLNPTSNAGGLTAFLTWTATGTNGEAMKWFVTDTDPTGFITGNPGDMCILVDGRDTELFQHQGSGASSNDWAQFLHTNTPTIEHDTVTTQVLIFEDDSTQQTGATPDGTAFHPSTFIPIATDSIASEDNQSLAIFVKPDGLKLWMVGNQTDDIFEYDLAAPWVITGLTYTGTELQLGNAPKALFWSTDGDTFLTIRSNNTIEQFAVGPVWDLNGASENGTFSMSALGVSNASSWWWHPDGLRFYIKDTSNLVKEFIAANPWDINTAPTAGNTFDAGFAGGLIAFRPDGRSMFLGDGDLIEYELPNPWDITGANQIDSGALPTANFSSLSFKQDGTKLIALDAGSDLIHEFDIGKKISSLIVGDSSSPEDSAIVEINTTTKGFLKPRMTTTQRDAIASPATGLEIYNTTTDDPEYFNGVSWRPVQPLTTNILYVSSLADLPAPVADSISIPDGTGIYIDGITVDLGVNNLVLLGNATIQGMVQNGSALTSSNAAGTIVNSGAKTLTIDKVDLFNTDGAAICYTMDDDAAIIFASDLQIFGNVAISRFRFVVFDLIQAFGTITFDSTANGSFIVNQTAWIQLSAIDSIVFEQGSALPEVSLGTTVNIITFAGGRGIVIENPDSVSRGSIIGTSFLGAGFPMACDPIAASSFSPPGTIPTGLGWDGVNLIIADTVDDEIVLMVGKTSVEGTVIASPGGSVRGVVWARGNLISCDETTDLIYIHDGFSTSILSSFATPAGNIQGITYDGTNLISVDGTTNLVYVHEGISATILRSFDPDTNADDLQGITFDGVNIILCDDAEIHVMECISGVKQYSIALESAAQDIVITDDGAALYQFSDTTVQLYDHPITFDHSAATWELRNNAGVTESADRGGSQYEDGNVAITVVQNIWTEIADGGTLIRYGAFNGMEKCRLNDELNGEVIWTGPRKRGSTISAQVVITRSGGGNTDIFYEIAISINGEIQTDGKGVGVLPTQSSFATVNTLPITKDLVAGDLIQVMIRNITDAVSPEVSVSKLSIN